MTTVNADKSDQCADECTTEINGDTLDYNCYAECMGWS